MKTKEKPKNIPIVLLLLSCSIYTPITLIINVICYFTLDGKLLQAWANLIVFTISLVIAITIFFIWKIESKNYIINCVSSIYTSISFSINAFVFIIMNGRLWTIGSLALIFSYSIVISVMSKYLKIKSYLIKTFIYYILSVVSFLVLTVGIGEYNHGNTVIILFCSFTIFYAICSVMYFYVKKSFFNFENEEKAYKKQFD